MNDLDGFLTDRMARYRSTYGEGARVRLRRDVERYPHFSVPAGSTGIVTNSVEDAVAVKMDSHVPGCEEWDNEIVWTVEDVLYSDLGDELEVIVSPRGGPHFSVRFEETMPDGEPCAFVEGSMERGPYVVQPDRLGRQHSAWYRSQDDRDSAERAPEWLQAALDALSAEWWNRSQRARDAEARAGWDPTP